MRLLRYLLVVTLAFTAAACSVEHSSPSSPSPTIQFANWPPTMTDFRFRWSAEPGIDLVNGPAVIVRAYLESHQLAELTSNMDATYPGFLRATPQNWPINGGPGPNQILRVRPWLDEDRRIAFGTKLYEQKLYFGNEYFHVLQLVPHNDGYQATVCDGVYDVFIVGDAGKYAPYIQSQYLRPPTDPGLYERDAISVRRIEFTQHDPRVGPNPPAPVTAPQRGPNPAPVEDVFGNWFIPGAARGGNWTSSDGKFENDPNLPQQDALCRQRMPDNEQQRAALLNGDRDNPPVAQPAVPGWPAATR